MIPARSPAIRRPSNPSRNTVAVPSSAVRMRCDSTLSMPNLAGMARKTVYAGGWTAVSNTRWAGVPTGA